MRIILALVAIFSLTYAGVINTVSDDDRKCAEDHNIPMPELEKLVRTQSLPPAQTASRQYKAMVKCIMISYTYITEDGEINENMNSLLKIFYQALKAVPKTGDNLDYVYNLAVALTKGVKIVVPDESSEEKTNTL